MQDVLSAASTFDRSALTDVLETAKSERELVTTLFPLDGWSTLPLDHYAFGTGDDSSRNFCRVMEFGTPELGSIRGGSAAKHIIYRHSDGGWRMGGPLDGMAPEPAWERLRSEFTTAFETVAAARKASADGDTDPDLDALDDLPCLVYGQALLTKSLATYFPDLFLPIYSAQHIRDFVRLLGGDNYRVYGVNAGGVPTWRANRALTRMVRARPEFDGWSPHEVMRFLYEHFDPREHVMHKIAPGEGGRMWADCLDNAWICVGWDAVGDLAQYTSDADLRDELDLVFPGKNSQSNLTLARELLKFRDLRPGDRVVANKGTSEVLGVGTVVDGYAYISRREEYRNTIPVRWDLSYAQKLPAPQPGWRSTFGSVRAPLWAMLKANRPASAETGSGETGTPPHPPEPPLDESVRRVVAALEAKGQAILHGPPGTGKTRLALSTALHLSGRHGAVDAPSPERDRAVNTMLEQDPAVRMISFHPSYGYEDFVEGIRPVLDGTPGTQGLVLRRSKGLFTSLCEDAAREPERIHLLIIDEINRADMPRVFGELITLLEPGKRGMSITLPVSQEPFKIPDNIRIVGTMNTADRSVGHLDAAIRRRFAFVDVGPDPESLSGSIGPLDLTEFLQALNARILQALDADRLLGHAYLLRADAPIASDEELYAVFYDDIVPLLEDFCLGRPELLRPLLGNLLDARTGKAKHVPVTELAQSLTAEFVPQGEIGRE